MKTIRIKTSISEYSKRTIMFDTFLLKFNEKCVAELEIDDDTEEEKLSKTVKSYSSLFYLEDEANQILEAEKEKDLNYLQKVISGKDEEIKILKLANEDLATKNTNLSIELKYLRQEKEKKEKIQTVDDSKLEKNSVKTEGDNANIEETQMMAKELFKKTVPELKAILESELSEFQSEWLGITKKEDIINYIVQKTVESDK